MIKTYIIVTKFMEYLLFTVLLQARKCIASKSEHGERRGEWNMADLFKL